MKSTGSKTYQVFKMELVKTHQEVRELGRRMHLLSSTWSQYLPELVILEACGRLRKISSREPMHHRDLFLEMTLMAPLVDIELSRTILVDPMLLLDSHLTTRIERKKVPKKTM